MRKRRPLSLSTSGSRKGSGQPSARRGWFEARRAFELHTRGKIEQAIDGYRAALVKNPAMAGAWYALGCAELAREAFGRAVPCFRRAISLRRGWAMAELDLGKALFSLGRVDAALAHVRRATRARDASVRREALGYLAVIVPGGARGGNRAVLQSRRAWARSEARSQTPIATRPRAQSGTKIRVGYVSAFFGFANWMKPVWAAVNHHDRSAFEIHLFADRAGPSATSGYRAHLLDQVHDITRFPNEAAARHVAAAKIDLLVDLNAYSFRSRLGLFMMRPAPVLVGWFNTYATTGIDAFDYIIGDDAVIPESEERFYTERVLRLSGSYLAFSVLHACPDVVPPPCLERGHLTFGSLGSQYKMTDEVVSAWSAILRGSPECRLLVKNRELAEPSNRSDLLRRFEQRGVPSSRILLEGGGEHLAFLAAYGKVDVALDTFPYSGGTTTMEALWQGVPVLTFNGDRWASRTSRSLLLAAGLGEWCMPDRARYIERAIALANAPETPKALAPMRQSMRERLKGSPACNGEGLARGLENLYRQMMLTKARAEAHARSSRVTVRSISSGRGCRSTRC